MEGDGGWGGGRGNFVCLNGDDENLKETFASAEIFTSFFFFLTW